MNRWNFICRLFSFKGNQTQVADSAHGKGSSESEFVAKEQKTVSVEESTDNTVDVSPVLTHVVPEKQRENEPLSEVSLPEDPDSDGDQLLDNKEYIYLMEECAALIAEFEQYHPRMQTDEGRMMVEMIGQRLREAMLLSGAQSIDSDRTFNILRHTPVPMHYVTNDTPLEEMIEMGIAVGNRVFVKAKVKVKENLPDAINRTRDKQQ